MLGPSLRMQKNESTTPPPPWVTSTVADTEGIHVVRLNPLLRQNYSTFMRNFKKKKNSINYQIIRYNFQIKAPFVNLNPLARNPGSAPVSTILFYLHGPAHMGPIWDPVALPIWVPIWIPYRLLAGPMSKKESILWRY